MTKKFSETDSADLSHLDQYRDGASYQQPLPGYPGTKSSYRACYNDHPPLALGGGTLIGGSCLNPVTDTADVYIGFDHGMNLQQQYPWDAPSSIQFLYPISDMCAPKSSKSFIKMIDWSIEQLAAGKTIHAGCIGGHGRTGTYISALVAALGIDKDAIVWTRENYCKKAVESETQVEFLVKHFGVKPVKGTKSFSSSKGSGKGWGASSKSEVATFMPKTTGGRELGSWGKPKGGSFADARKVFNPVKSAACIFGTIF